MAAREVSLAVGVMTRILENPMQHHAVRDGCLRLVFGDVVLSFGISRDITLGEIARAVGSSALLRHGRPVAIDVTLGEGAGGVEREI